ncbi:MAG: sporulation protein YabP [Clostridia bacterium]|nr:sporulation protein YabP [Clostridia bacterium]
MERKERTAPPQPHQLIMQDRRQVELTGVADVDSFDENAVIAYTSMGELTIRGSGLHIRQLNLEGGSLSLEGQVDSLTYSDAVKGGGFFSRLLR